MHLRNLALAITLATATSVSPAQSLAPIHAKCAIGLNETASQFSLQISDTDCPGDRHCGSNFSNESMSRFTGITLADLNYDGAQLTATLAAEAGTFTCSGTVHGHELRGDALFTPDSAFISRMAQLGFNGFDTEKLQAYTFINVTYRLRPLACSRPSSSASPSTTSSPSASSMSIPPTRRASPPWDTNSPTPTD